MNTIFYIAALATVVMAAPQRSYNRPNAFVGSASSQFQGSQFQGSQFQSRPFIPILNDNRNGPINGVYDFNFEAGNGIRVQEQGNPSGPNGAVVSQGGWSFTFPDGTPAQFSFIADENGYRVDSPLLPTPPPMPAHALEQIAHAERERAQGIFHDGQYDPARYGGGHYTGSSHTSRPFRPSGSRRYN